MKNMEKKERLFNKSTTELLKEKPNEQLAVKLMEESHNLGFAKASYAIGTWYLHGVHYKKNLKKGIQYIKIAVKENIPEALFDLAVSYESGLGITKNEKKAFEYYLRAALKGDKEATAELGRLYYYGIGVNKNKILADIWLERAEDLAVSF